MSANNNIKTYIDRLKEFDKVIIFGPFPPPIGGISVHLHRLIHILKNTIQFDTSNKNIFRSLLFIPYILLTSVLKKNTAIYINAARIDVLLFNYLYSLIPNNSKIIYYIHNETGLERYKGMTKLIYLLLIKRIDILIFSSENGHSIHLKEGLKTPKEVYIQSAFLPPPKIEKEKIIATYPKSLTNFINNYRTIVTSSAYKVDFYNNQDLYGFDLFIKLAEQYSEYNGNKIGFIFCIADIAFNEQYIHSTLNKVSKEVRKNIYILDGQRKIWPIIEQSHIMLRLTNTDADSISIREALLFNCKVIASDVTKRPENVHLFKNRDLKDLCNVFEKTISKND